MLPSPIFHETSELMDPKEALLARRGQKQFWLGGIWGITVSLASVSGKVAYVVCKTGTLTTVYGNIAGSGACLAAAGLWLVSTFVAAGLTAAGVVTTRDLPDSVYSRGSNDIFEDGNFDGIYHFDMTRHIDNLMESVGLTKRDSNFEVLSWTRVSNLTDYPINDIAQYPPSASPEGWMPQIIHRLDNITQISIVMQGTEEDLMLSLVHGSVPLTKRGKTWDLNYATFGAKYLNSNLEHAEAADAYHDEYNKKNNLPKLMESFFSSHRHNRYCMSGMDKNGDRTVVRGEMVIDNKVKPSSKC